MFPDAFESFYQNLTQDIGPELSSYVTQSSTLTDIRDTILTGHELLINNVARKPVYIIAIEMFPLLNQQESWRT